MNTAILIGGPLNGEPRTFMVTDYPSTLTLHDLEGTAVYERTDEYRNEMRVYRYREQSSERSFWMGIRQALLMALDTIERQNDVSPRTAELRKAAKRINQ
jgi:hypothetical protein